jgi:hypothetical protein
MSAAAVQAATRCQLLRYKSQQDVSCCGTTPGKSVCYLDYKQTIPNADTPITYNTNDTKKPKFTATGN